MSAKQPCWEVRLNGGQADLERLAKALPGPDLVINLRDGEAYLGGAAFECLPDSHAVREVGVVVANALSASLRIDPPLTPGIVARLDPDGSRATWIHVPCAEMEISVPPVSVTATDLKGLIKDIGAARAGEDALKALGSEAVRKVQRLLLGGKLGWTDLVRIYEVIEDDGGAPRGSWNWRQGQRLTATANSVALTGDECRHGSEKRNKEPPPDPMTPWEARSFIHRLMRDWLDSK